MSTRTIDGLSVGDVVHGANGYSRVAKCVHGNTYYAYLGDEYDGDVIEVSDDDADHVPCCG